MAEHNEIGKIGEKIAQSFLVKHGFSIIEINYHTRYGEIDIIAKKGQTLHFVEVKSVKVKDFADITNLAIQPEDNLTAKKWSRIVISAQTYLKHRNVPHETLWCIDLACVYINPLRKEGKVKLLENVHRE